MLTPGWCEKMIEQGARHAVFDLDNTLVRSNIVWPYVFVRRQLMGASAFAIWVGAFGIVASTYFRWLDRHDRVRLQHNLFERYHRLPYDAVVRLSAQYANSCLSRKPIGAAFHLFTFLKKRGINLSILSTGISPVVVPVAQALGVPCHCIAVANHRGFCRVDIESLPGFKERIIQLYDPDQTIMVADSVHDLPVLKWAKFPVVVAPIHRPWMDEIDQGVLIRWRGRDSNTDIEPLGILK